VLRIADDLDADFVLLILSPASVDSKWVNEEWTDAYWATGKTRSPGWLWGEGDVVEILVPGRK
jgi:hypothetical protein